MFKKYKHIYVFVYLGLSLIIILGFTVGYIYTTVDIQDNSIDENTIEKYVNQASTTKSIGNEQTRNVINDKSSEKKVLETKEVYSICGHTIITRTDMPEDIISMDENSFILAYDDWKIEKFSQNEIIISKIINKKCHNHYILKEMDEKVAIFYQEPVDGVFLKELTNIQIANLKVIDQERLRNGITIDSNEQLAEILEDFNS